MAESTVEVAAIVVRFRFITAFARWIERLVRDA